MAEGGRLVVYAGGDIPNAYAGLEAMFARVQAQFGPMVQVTSEALVIPPVLEASGGQPHGWSWGWWAMALLCAGATVLMVWPARVLDRLEAAPPVAASGAAGLTEAQHPLAGSTETIRQTGQLRGLSRAFPSFERNEFTGDRHAPSRCPPKGSKRAEKPSAHKKARHEPGLFERTEPRLNFQSALG